MGLHRDALDLAVRANRVEPRRNDRDTWSWSSRPAPIGRWHKVDGPPTASAGDDGGV